MSEFERVKEEMCERLKRLEGSKLNICYDICQNYLFESDNFVDLLKCYYEQVEKKFSNRDIVVEEIFSKEKEQEYLKKYGKLVGGILEKTLKQKLCEQDFYEEISKLVLLDDLFEDKCAKAFAIYYIGLDARIPYFEISGSIEMDQDTYVEITNKIMPVLQKARFILASDCEQWSVLGDRLVKTLDEVQESEEKAVLMSHILKVRGEMAVQTQMLQRLKALKGDLDDLDSNE